MRRDNFCPSCAAALEQKPRSRYCDKCRDEEAEAKGKLFSAAPEMLKALQAIQASLAIFGGIAPAAEELIEPAISKALGSIRQDRKSA